MFARDFSKVKIETVEVAANLYLFYGAGGNVAVAVGDDGVFYDR